MLREPTVHTASTVPFDTAIATSSAADASVHGPVVTPLESMAAACALPVFSSSQATTVRVPSFAATIRFTVLEMVARTVGATRVWPESSMRAAVML